MVEKMKIKKSILFTVLIILLLLVFYIIFTIEKKNFTVISYNAQAITQESKRDIENLIKKLHAEDSKNSPNHLNNIVKVAGTYFTDKNTPYSAINAQGEGSWCDSKMVVSGCAHVQQNPIYRTDSFDCTTFVQAVLALVNADNIKEYNNNIIHINYGIAHLVAHQPFKISYSNRNNFVSGDFNRVNEKTGRIKDVTRSGVFRKIAKITSANITRADWFAHQASPNLIRYNVIVLDKSDGPAMVQRFQNHYASFYKPEQVSIPYIPKEALVKKIKLPDSKIQYQANKALINQIPTPSVVEIVRDVHKWNINGKNIQDIIKSGINVSHVGLLYQQKFNYNDTIFQHITCQYDVTNNKICAVTPVICLQKRGCNEIMMVAATDQFPDGYSWSYDENKNHYYCTSKQAVPVNAKVLGACNRVYKEPLASYLTSYMYDQYMMMDSDSIVGINIQKILKPKS